MGLPETRGVFLAGHPRGRPPAKGEQAQCNVVERRGRLSGRRPLDSRRMSAAHLRTAQIFFAPAARLGIPLGVTTPCPYSDTKRALDRLWEPPLYCSHCSSGRPGGSLLRIPPSLWVSQKLGGILRCNSPDGGNPGGGGTRAAPGSNVFLSGSKIEWTFRLPNISGELHLRIPPSF